MQTSIPVDGPKNVTIEASLDVIIDQHLDTFNNEQFDTIMNVIAITVDSDTVTFESCRSLEAMRAGLPNAGRGTFEIPRSALQCIYIDKAPVWGRPGGA